MPHRKIIRRWQGIAVFFAVLFAATLLVSFFVWRAYQTTRSDVVICKKIDRLDAALIAIVSHSTAPKIGQYGFTYWKSHHLTEPDGAPGGVPPAAVIKALRLAACDPDNLPSKGIR